MLVALLLAVSAGTTAEAADVRVVSPAQGAALRRDQVELELEVLGEPLSTYAVHVNGAQDTVVVVTDAAGRGVGGTILDVFPLQRTRVAVAAAEGAEDSERLYRVLTLDLWGPQDGVWSSAPLERERVVLLDLRTWGDSEEPLIGPDEALLNGLAVGLTAAGLSRLEAPLLSELPAGPLLSFDAVLAARIGEGVPAGARRLPADTCVPLEEVPLSVQAALAPQIAQALTAAAAVPVCKRALDMTTVGAWAAAVLVHGYEQRPGLGTRADLALCVEGLDASLVDLWTRGVAVGLEGVEDALLAETWHLAPAGLVDVDLTAWLVYRDGVYEAGPCPLVAAQAMPEELAVCPALPLGAEEASGDPVALALSPTSDAFSVGVDQESRSSSVLWEAWLDPSADGLCGHPLLADEVAGLMDEVAPTAAGLLDDAWDAGSPTTSQLSEGLEGLLKSWSMTQVHPEPVAVEARMTELVELRADPDDWRAPQGLMAFYDTLAEPLEPWPLNQHKIYAPEVVPWPDTGAQSWWGTEVDARLAVSTGALNQVLAAAAPTDVLSGPAMLDSAALAALLPELQGHGELAARLRWPVAPAVTMAPTGVDGDESLLFHVAGLELVVHLASQPEDPLLVLAIDALDPAFELLLGEGDGALEGDLVFEVLDAMVLSHQLSDWPSEDGLPLRLRPWIEAEVVPRLLQAITLLPVPEFQGLVAPVRLVEPEAPYQGGDVVLFSIRFVSGELPLVPVAPQSGEGQASPVDFP